MEETKDSSIPNAFLCSITHELMTDPVIASDGHTYERSAIQRWFRTKEVSPKTNLPMRNTTLIKNYSLISAMEELNITPSIPSIPTPTRHHFLQRKKGYYRSINDVAIALARCCIQDELYADLSCLTIRNFHTFIRDCPAIYHIPKSEFKVVPNKLPRIQGGTMLINRKTEDGLLFEGYIKLFLSNFVGVQPHYYFSVSEDTPNKICITDAIYQGLYTNITETRRNESMMYDVASMYPAVIG